MTKKKQEEKEDTIPQDDGIDEDIKRTLDGDEAINKFLGGDEFVNDLLGVKLKPVTLASLAMMQEAGCELISGKEMDEMSNIMLEVLLFVYIHTEDPEKIAEIISNSEDHQKALKMRALTMGHKITPKQIPELVEQIVEILSEATGTKVDPLPDEDDKGEKKTKTKG